MTYLPFCADFGPLNLGHTFKFLCKINAIFTGLISHTVFVQLFCKKQFPHKYVNLFSILIIVQDKLTYLLGSYLMQNDLENTLRKITPTPLGTNP